jgi:hypothetical protein
LLLLLLLLLLPPPPLLLLPRLCPACCFVKDVKQALEQKVFPAPAGSTSPLPSLSAYRR